MLWYVKAIYFIDILKLQFCMFEPFWPWDSAYLHYPTLPAKTSCFIPSTHLQGFRNYIATILKSYLGGMSIILFGLLCAGQCHVTCCIVMFCCFPLLTVGDILLPVFFIVRICSSTGVVISRVLTVGATLFSMVLNIQATILVAFSRVLTVWATQFFTVLTVQATMLSAFSQVLTVWATQCLWCYTVQATIIFSSVVRVNCFSHPKLFHGC